MKHKQLSEILRLLALQSGEEKIRIALDLSAFVRKLRKEGEQNNEKNRIYKSRIAT